jgi:hypothetical protein
VYRIVATIMAPVLLLGAFLELGEADTYSHLVGITGIFLGAGMFWGGITGYWPGRKPWRHK